MTLLDDIISDASNDGVSTSSLLRKVMVVASRLEAGELTAWAERELSGYGDGDEPPKYRGPYLVNVMGQWVGPFGMERLAQVGSSSRVPADLHDSLFRITFLQGVDALEGSMATGSEMSIPWDPIDVGLWNKLIEGNAVPRFQGMQLARADRVIPTALFRQVLGGAKTNALRLALDLQGVNPDIGSPTGPTIADPSVGASVQSFYVNVYGGNVNVAQGTDIHQELTVNAADLDGLLAAAHELGLTAEADSDLRDAVTAPEAERPHRIRAFLEHVRNGTYAFAIAVSGEIVAGRLEPLIHQYLGG